MNMMGAVNYGTNMWQTLTALVAMAVFVGTVGFVLRQCLSSYRFLRRLHAGTARGAWWRVVLLIVHVARRRPASLKSSKEPLLRFVRIRAEHEIFTPRPIRKWPLATDDERYGAGDLALDIVGKPRTAQVATRKKARAAGIAHHKRLKRDWIDRMGKVLDERDPASTSNVKAMIEIEHAGDLNAALPTIKRYFDTLKTMNLPDEVARDFYCTISVKIGFIASQYLISGLLVRYNQDWGPIIRGFERDTNASRTAINRDVRQIQSFIYNCWLLWGPSIPICGTACKGWHADFATLQFGYGDENNAIEIAGETAHLRQKLLAQIARVGADHVAGAMAVPAGVRGRLRYSSMIDTSQTIPETVKTSWESPRTERPVLMMSKETLADFDADYSKEYETTGGIVGENHGFRKSGPGPSRYYSAYFWIMFILLRNDGGNWVPLDPEPVREDGFHDASAEPWKGAIPFFEHGNMADPESCRFSKRQLANKVISGIAELDALAPGTIRFAYACAIDDGHCSQPLWCPELQGGDTVRTILEDLLRTRAAFDPAAALVGNMIDFDMYRPTAPLKPDPDAVSAGADPSAAKGGKLNPHSACAQTKWVGDHFHALAGQ